MCMGGGSPAPAAAPVALAPPPAPLPPPTPIAAPKVVTNAQNAARAGVSSLTNPLTIPLGGLSATSALNIPA